MKRLEGKDAIIAGAMPGFTGIMDQGWKKSGSAASKWRSRSA